MKNHDGSYELFVSVPYSEQHLTADEVERRLGNNTLKWGKECYDDREPEIWLSEMYEIGYNMTCLEGTIIEYAEYDTEGKFPQTVTLQ